MTSGFALTPTSAPPEELTDTLIRLAWYGAPAFLSGYKLFLPDTAVMRNAVAGQIPKCFSSLAAKNFHELPQHIVWQDNAPKNAISIWWKMGPDGYRFDDKSQKSKYHIRVDEWADKDAAITWVNMLGQFTHWKPSVHFQDLIEVHSNRKIEIAGPGPSSLTLKEREKESETTRLAGLSAYTAHSGDCHTTVDIVVFCDKLEVLGPSRASQIARETLEVAAQNGAWLVTHAPLAKMCSHFLSETACNRMVGLPLSSKIDLGIPASETEGHIRDTQNMLTTIALPVAASLGKNLTFYGFDTSFGTSGGWGHSSASNYKRVLDLKNTHPLIGLSDDYHATHRANTDQALSHLTNRDWKISVASHDGHIHPVHREPVTKNAGVRQDEQAAQLLRRIAYYAVRQVDRHPAITAALLLSTLLVILPTISIGFNMPVSNVAIWASVGLLSMFFILGGIALRRRQDRLNDGLRRDLTRQTTQAIRALAERQDQIEDAVNKKSDQTDD